MPAGIWAIIIDRATAAKEGFAEVLARFPKSLRDFLDFEDNTAPGAIFAMTSQGERPPLPIPHDTSGTRPSRIDFRYPQRVDKASDASDTYASLATSRVYPYGAGYAHAERRVSPRQSRGITRRYSNCATK